MAKCEGWDIAKFVARAVVAQSKLDDFTYHSFVVIDGDGSETEFGDWSWQNPLTPKQQAQDAEDRAGLAAKRDEELWSRYGY